MKMKFLVAAAAIALGVAAVAQAAGEPQAERKAMMKQIGGAMGTLGAISKGEKPFDAEAVKAALTTISADAKAFPNLFPVGSESGDTAAAPKIWEDPAGFKAVADKMASAADAQLASMPADAAGVGAAMRAVGGICGECHQAYRVKR